MSTKLGTLSTSATYGAVLPGRRDVGTARDQFPSPRTPILHPTFQVLELGLWSPSCQLDNLFLTISLPSLKSYTCDGGYHGHFRETAESYIAAGAVFLFLEDVVPSSQQLDDTDISNLFAVTFHIRHLELTVYTCGADVMGRIFRRVSILPSCQEPTRKPITSSSLNSNQWYLKDRCILIGDLHQACSTPSLLPTYTNHVGNGLCAVTLTISPYYNQPGRSDMSLDKETLRKILFLTVWGFHVQITSGFKGWDFLQQSVAFHSFIA
ncbi:hypothetical protein BDZ97DRAFT_1761178 [Flammula alnicola]|nr:hypothetical protein BDZ97DRAFT_1761178 [Flammula alnicola]